MQGIDEEAQAQIGRQAAGTGVRRGDQARVLQVHHHVADRGGRQVVRQDPGDGARAHRLAGLEIGVDQLPEDVARALVEPGDAREAVFVEGDGLGGMMLMAPM